EVTGALEQGDCHRPAIRHGVQQPGRALRQDARSSARRGGAEESDQPGRSLRTLVRELREAVLAAEKLSAGGNAAAEGRQRGAKQRREPDAAGRCAIYES